MPSISRRGPECPGAADSRQRSCSTHPVGRGRSNGLGVGEHLLRHPLRMRTVVVALAGVRHNLVVSREPTPAPLTVCTLIHLGEVDHRVLARSTHSLRAVLRARPCCPRSEALRLPASPATPPW